MKLHLAVLSLLAFTATANADFTNYNSLLIGGQAAGMGGAATAMTSDVSAIAYYNPAALAVLEGRSFSAAVGVYKKFDTLYGQKEDITKVPLRINQGFFQAIPSSLGNVFRYGDYTFGLSIVVPDYDNYKGDLTSSSQNTTTLSYTDQSLWVGGAIARKISDSEAVGVTFYYTARSYDRTLTDQSFPSGSQAILYNSEKILAQNAIVAVLGYHKKFSESWNFGVSLRPPNLAVTGQGSYFETTVNTSPYSNNNISQPNEKTEVHIPGKLTLGVAYRQDDDWVVALDTSVYQPLDYTDFQDPTYATHFIHQMIWNVSVGAEKKFFPWLKTRAGFFTNFSAVPNPDVTQAPSQPDRVDQLGFSANAAFTSSDKIEYTFGGYYTGGWGRSVERVNQQLQELPVTKNVFTMLVGTSFYF